MRGVTGNRFARRGANGFTMIELTIAAAVAALAAVATMLVFSAQNRAAEGQRGRVDAQQNARAAADVLVREIRQAGANIDKFHFQSILIDAAPYQLAFNADVRGGAHGDPAMQSTASVPLADGTTYSPGAFLNENLADLSRFNNGAETIRLTLDTNGDGAVTQADTLATTRVPGDFQLVRQVNGGSAETVAYGLRGPGRRADNSLPAPLFQYWGDFSGNEHVLWGDTNRDGSLSQSEIQALGPVSRAELQNVREITLNIDCLSDDQGAGAAARDDASTRLTTTVQPRNVGLNEARLSACGNPPEAPLNVRAADTPDDAGRSITLAFSASIDDNTGEQDVREYSIYRRREGESGFGAAIYNLQATRAANYMFVNDETHSLKAEDAPEDGVAYEYYVTAWDCEPQESDPSQIAGPVQSQPNGPLPPIITEVFDTPCDGGGDITVSFAASPADDPSWPTFTGYRVYRGTSQGHTAYKARVLDVPAEHHSSYTVHDVSGGLLPMSADSSYYYVVRAVRGGIESVDSNQYGPVSVSDGLARPVLTAVEDVPGDFGQRLQVSWSASPSEGCAPPANVSSYEVLRRSEHESLFDTVHEVTTMTGGVYTWTDTLVLADVLFTYQVRARDGMGRSVMSNEMSGRSTAENSLQPPVALHVDDEPCDPNGAIRIDWQASPSDAGGEMTDYRILRGTQAGVYDYELPWVSATGQPTYTLVDDASLSGANAPRLGVTYYYVGRSWNAYYHLQSANSSESSVAAESTPTSPGMTSVADTPNDGGRSITVHFARSDHDGNCDQSVTSYRLYRGTDPGAVNTWIGSVTALQQPSYTFIDDLVHSFDPPQDGVPYFYAARAYANELVSKLSNVGGPATAVRDGTANEILWADNFEIDRGWTHGAISGTDDWTRGAPQGRTSLYGNPDPTAATSGTNCWGNSFGPTQGTYNRSCKVWLMSPMIDCRSASHVKLVFQRWLNVEKSTRDLATIEVRNNSGTWSQVWINSSSLDLTDSSWGAFALDISMKAAGKNNVQVRFLITSNSSKEYTGWNIDDFVLEKF